MIKTYGLTHISLTVQNIDTSYNFYHNVFGVVEYWRDENSIHSSTPGTNDVITFVKGIKPDNEGINHFGFRLIDPKDINDAIAEIEKAGGKIIEQGEFSSGYPYAYASDPDGYIFEVWFE